MKTVYYLHDKDSMGKLGSTISAPTLGTVCNINGNLGVKHELEGVISLYPFDGSSKVRGRWYCTPERLMVVKTRRVK